MAKINKKMENRVQRDEPMINVSLGDYAYRQPVDPRRRPEYHDAQLIREDHRAMANLPEKAIHREFRPGKYMPNYWMESEIEPFGAYRENKPEEL